MSIQHVWDAAGQVWSLESCMLVISNIIARKCIKSIPVNLTFDKFSSSVLWEGAGLCNDFLLAVYPWQSSSL